MIEKKLELIRRVLESRNLCSNHGNNVELFEYRLAKYVGSEHAIAVNSGTAALHTALLALGIGPGDEIIVPAWTFISTVSAVVMCGATPVFADIKSDSFNLDSASILDKITPKTKAVIIVHLAGIPMDFTDIGWILSDKGIAIVEDACQALGAELYNDKVGTIGDIGVYSFYPSKIITTGEGGMIVTNDTKLDFECRLIRDHGRISHFYADRLGFNYRMTEIQGALGLVELEDLDKRISQNINRYMLRKYECKGNYRFPRIPKNSKIAPTYSPVWNTYKLLVPGFYIPLYKLAPFKQNIKLTWTEFAATRSMRLDI